MTLMLGKIEGKRRGWQRMRWLDAISNAKDLNLGKLCDMVMNRKTFSPWGRKESGKIEWLSNNCSNTSFICNFRPSSVYIKLMKISVKLWLKTVSKVVEVMELQLSYFNFWKMMLSKCCTQYGSKFGKLSSGHRTGKGQFSFQSQRKAMPKNAQTTAQLHSSYMLLK